MAQSLPAPDVYTGHGLVKVVTGGHGISRNDDIDISCNELYNNDIAVLSNE